MSWKQLQPFELRNIQQFKTGEMQQALLNKILDLWVHDRDALSEFIDQLEKFDSKAEYKIPNWWWEIFLWAVRHNEALHKVRGTCSFCDPEIVE